MQYVLDTCTFLWLAVHNDPADRFILVTAQVIGARILSPDGIMPQYPGFTVEW
jgi:PIN domain nuclease of toxin-antitoxin system